MIRSMLSCGHESPTTVNTQEIFLANLEDMFHTCIAMHAIDSNHQLRVSHIEIGNNKHHYAYLIIL